MKISSIAVYRVELPVGEGSYNWSNANTVSVFDSTVVEIATDAGITGWGEVCPLGSAYLPSYPAGARTGIQELAPKLIDMIQPEVTENRMLFDWEKSELRPL